MRTFAALLLFALLLFAVLTFAARADGPWLKPDDVVALVGGEDMVALAEEGWLETLVTWAQPKDRIRWRSLAWEGDTVFEQRRDLNYPALEAQLDRMGATVVICQFGKMESFAGKEGVAAFTEAYEKLLARLGGEKKRRIALVLPMRFAKPPKANGTPSLPDLTSRNGVLESYREAIISLAAKHGAIVLDADYCGQGLSVVPPAYPTRDGIHLLAVDDSALEYFVLGEAIVDGLGDKPLDHGQGNSANNLTPESITTLRNHIVAKNRLWFHYTRPQNWAFLAGNRTNQPSSRDHLDPTKRWFPSEMELWVPLIEAKEKEIQALAEAPR